MVESIFRWFLANCRKLWRERNLISLHLPIFVAFGFVVMLATGVLSLGGSYLWLSSMIGARDNEIRIKNATIEQLQNGAKSVPLQQLTASKTPSSSPHANLKTPREIRELLNKLPEAHKILDGKIGPVINDVRNTAIRWRDLLVQIRMTERLTILETRMQIEVWDEIDNFIEQNKKYTADLQTAFILDHVAAKGELRRQLRETNDAVNRLPANATSKIDDLSPQFTELKERADTAIKWLEKAKERTAIMIHNLNRYGITGFER